MLTNDEVEAIRTHRCPDCGFELDHGVWIPTMTADLECGECHFQFDYPQILDLMINFDPHFA